MGGSKTTTTSSNTVDPAQMALIMQNYNKASDIADTPFTPYTGEQVAPFSSTQLAGQQALLNAANDPSSANTLNAAKGATNALLNYATPSITSPGTLAAPGLTSPGSLTAHTVNAPTITSPGTLTPSSVTAQRLAGTDLSPYLNPYTQDVVDTSLSDLSRARAQQQVSDNQAATAAGAFGGTRQAVQNALSSDNYLRNVASTTANLRSNAYTNAQQAALSDIGNQINTGEYNATNAQNAGIYNLNNALAIQQANAANQFAADQYNASAGTAADQYNLGNLYDLAKTNAANQFAADQYNLGNNLAIQQANAANNLAGANLQLGASSQLAGMSSQQLTQALQQAGVIEGVGQEQTQQQQSLDDASYQEFLRQLAYPLQQQSIRNSALGMIPLQETTTGTQANTPGFLDYLNGIGNFAHNISGFVMPSG